MSTQRSAYAVGAPPVIFAQSKQTALGLANLLALMVRLALRRNVGLDLVSKANLIGMTLFLLLVSWLGNLHVSLSFFGGVGVQSDNDTSLKYFALFVFLPLGIWQRVQRLREEKRGLEPHTLWAGDGWWGSFLPLPRKYLDKFIDPLVAFLAGALLRYRMGCELLGLWVMFSAVALLFVEWSLYARLQDEKRSDRNLGMEARWKARIFSQGPSEENEAPARAASIPTGNDDGLLAQIEKRKLENEWAEKNNPGVDNGNAF